MYERNRDRSFANSRGNTLYIAAVHISDSKNPRQCCFQQVWPAAEGPVRVVQFLRRQIGTGLDEAFAVEHDAAAVVLQLNRELKSRCLVWRCYRGLGTIYGGVLA